MLKIFFAFVEKESLHILHDTRTLIILFGMPIALVLIFGYAVSTEFKGASIAVYDKAKDNLSRSFIEHITASGHFEGYMLANNVEEINAGFKAGDIKIGFVIPDRFEERFYDTHDASIQIITDATEPNSATTLMSYATQMVSSFRETKIKEKNIPYRIDIKRRMFYNPKLISAYMFVPGVAALLLMLICAMMTSLTIAKEKETGTMDLLLISPLSPIIIILGKVAPYTILSFISALIVFAMGRYVFQVPILGSLTLLLGVSLLYLLVSLSIGILVSTVVKNQQTAMIISLFSLLLPTMLLSGFIFPIESMPVVLQYLCHIFPAKYFITIEKAIMLKGAGWSSIYQPVLVLVFMLFVLILIARKKFKVIYT